MSTKKIGVLIMSYGTPESLDQIEDYYTHIRRGKPPTVEQLNDLKSRYEAIVGGFFPLRENTNKQFEGIQAELSKRNDEIEFICYQGLKHAFPFVEDGVELMAADGISKAIGIVLAPHYSTMSVGSYIKRAKDKADELGIEMSFVESYHMKPKFLEALSIRLDHALNKFKGVERNQIKVLFSAHSLPERILKVNDPYPEQLLETSKALVARHKITNWQFAWQSAGRTPEPWLGPDILDVLQSIHDESNVRNVLIAPIGFVSDHLEVLFDIDIECQAFCKKLGIHLERTASLNVDPLYLETIADCVRERQA